MGVCCSTTAKETGASSSRHFVSVSSSPSLFPTENERNQDSAVANHIEETCSRFDKTEERASMEDLNEVSSAVGVFETDVVPMWVELCEETSQHHSEREKKETFESVSQQRHSWTGAVEKWSEESSTENEDGGNNVIALKACSSGAIRRLKKKDSTRQPKYKDEIMLTDNIDSIVEKEIPEIPDEITSEAEAEAGDIDYILNDDLPAAESNGINVIGSNGSNSPRSSVTPRSSAKPNKKKADNALAEDIDYILNDDMPPAESKGPSSPNSDVISGSSVRRNTAKKEDNKLERDIQYILSDGKPGAKSNGTSPSITGAAPGPKTIYAKRRNRKMDGKKQVQNDPLANLATKQHLRNYPTKEEDIKEDQKAKDVECVLNDDVATAESGGKTSSGADSSTKKAHRAKKNSTSEKYITEEEKLAGDINYILKDDVPAVKSKGQIPSGTVSPSQKARRAKKNSTREKDITEEEKLADDINYILKDDVPAVKSKGQISSGTVSPSQKARRAKKNSTKEKDITEVEKLADDIDYILNDNVATAASIGQMSSSRGSPTKKARPPKKCSAKEKEFKDDDELVNNIGFFFNDDIPVAESQGRISTGKVSSTKKAQSHNKSAISEKEITDDEKLGNDIDYILNDDIPPVKSRKHFKQADEQLDKDIQYILNDDPFAAEPNEGISSSPCGISRPKTSNPKLMLAMDMDRIFDPASVASANQVDDELAKNIKAVQAAPNETMSSRSGAAPRPRKKTRRRKSKYMTIVEDLAEESNPNASVISTSVVSLSQSDFSSSSGTAKHQRQHCMGKKESMADKAASKDSDNTIKEDYDIAETNGSIPCTSSPLPRSKTSKPKRVLTMNMSDTHGSSPAASSYRVVPRPKRECFQKPRQATYKSAKDSSVWAASSGKILSRACAIPRTNSNNNSIKKSNDILIVEEVDSTEQITSNSCTMSRSPKVSPREQNHAKDVIAGKNSDDKLQDTKGVASIRSAASSASAGTGLRKKHSTRQPKETEETNLDEMINDILEIPTVDSGASGESLSVVGTSLRKKNSRTQPNKSKHTEEINLEEAIDEMLEIPTLDDGDSKQKAKLNSMSKERNTNSRKKVTGESRGEECNSKKPIAQTTSVPDIGFPDAKAGSSTSVDTVNCDSGCSVASGDTMRPMSAGSSRVKSMGCSTSKLPSSHLTGKHLSKKRQTLPAILIKEENTVRKPRMRASKETAVPLLGGLQGMTTYRKATVPVTSGNSPRSSPGIFYKSEELELMKQIERDSRFC